MNNKKPIIAMASDHTAYGLKAGIIEFLTAKGFECRDFGAGIDVKESDYPDFSIPAARAVAAGECCLGILVCGTGIGMSIAANKIRGIRAAVCGDTFSARAAREHNDANVLCIGKRVTGSGLALDIVDIFVSTEFSGEERHIRRLQKISDAEIK